MGDPEVIDGAALARVLRQPGGAEMLHTLGVRLSDPELATLLLAAVRTRASLLSPGDVLRRYGGDRLVVPAAVEFRSLRRAEDLLLAALPAETEMLELAPVTPLGSHAAVVGVDQNGVLATVRGTEVSADPVTGLALEAAVRRRDGPGPDAGPVRLAAFQRVLRSRPVSDGGSAGHRALFALLTAGADPGGPAFRRRHCVEHLRVVSDAVRAAGASRTEIRITVLHDKAAPLARAVRGALGKRAGVVVLDVPAGTDDGTAADRPSGTGRSFHTGLRFTVSAVFGQQRWELGAGGFLDWTRRLLDDPAECLLASVVNVDRLAQASDQSVVPGSGS